MTDDDDIVRRALGGEPRPVDAHRALQQLRPSMRRAQTNRRIATVAAAAIIVTGSGAAALTIAGRPDTPTLRTFTTMDVDGVTASVSTTIVVADPSGLADDASSVDPSSTSSSLRTTTTGLAEPVPPPAEPSVVEPSNPPRANPAPVDPAPGSSLPAPQPGPEPTLTTTTATPAVATSTTITSLCGEVVVTIESGRVSIASISAAPGFDATVGTDGPTSVELVFRSDAGTCEIHAELERGALDVEVQNPDPDD